MQTTYIKTFKDLFHLTKGENIALMEEKKDGNLKERILTISRVLSGKSGDTTFLINDNKNVLKIFKDYNTQELKNNNIVIKVLKNNVPKVVSNGIFIINGVKHTYFVMDAVQSIKIRDHSIGSLKDLIVYYCNKADIKLELFLIDIFWAIFLIIEKLFKYGIKHCDLHDGNVMITEVKHKLIKTRKSKSKSKSKPDLLNYIKYDGKYYRVILLDMGMLSTAACSKHNRKQSFSIINTSYRCSAVSFKSLSQSDATHRFVARKILEYFKMNGDVELSDWFFYINLICSTGSIVNFGELLRQFQDPESNFKEIIHFILYRDL